MKATTLLIALLTVAAHPQPFKIGDCVQTEFATRKYDDLPRQPERGRITHVFRSSTWSSLQYQINDSDVLHVGGDLRKCRGCRRCKRKGKR